MPPKEFTFAVATRVPIMDMKDLPPAFRGKVSAVCRSLRDCEDLVHWYGAAEFCPFKPILMVIPGVGFVQLEGMGYASAAELRDDAVQIWITKTERALSGQTVVDFDDLRERRGLMRSEDVPAAMGEAFQERIRQHKANPITDPARQPLYPRVRGKTVFPQPQGGGWKKEQGHG